MKRLKVLSIALLGLGIFVSTAYAEDPGRKCFYIQGAQGVGTLEIVAGIATNVGGGIDAGITSLGSTALEFCVTNYRDGSNIVKDGSQEQTGTFNVQTGDGHTCSGTWTHRFFTDTKDSSKLHDRFWAVVTSPCRSNADSESNAKSGHDKGDSVVQIVGKLG
jgi:hypothetical protein